MSPSPWQLILVMIILLVLFGSKLPTMARNIGRGVVEFKKGVAGIEDEIDDEIKKSKKKTKKKAEADDEEEEEEDDSEE